MPMARAMGATAVTAFLLALPPLLVISDTATQVPEHLLKTVLYLLFMFGFLMFEKKGGVKGGLFERNRWLKSTFLNSLGFFKS
jgi:hypothetical protein